MTTVTPATHWMALAAGALLGGCVGWGYEYWKMAEAYSRLEGRLAAVMDDDRASELIDDAKDAAALPAHLRSYRAEWSDDTREKLDAIGVTRARELRGPYRHFLDRRLAVGFVFALPGALLGLSVATLADRRSKRGK